MDILSHALWGGLAAGRENKRAYWTAFGIGLAPDILSFGIYTAADVLGIVSGPEWGNGIPDPATIPDFVHALYHVTHSLIVFIVIFGLIWLWRRKPFIPLLAWGVHILVDIPTHSQAFFPTPFLWPLSDYTFNGIGWGQPIVYFPNLALLALGYSVWGIWYWQKKKHRS